jgi:hypothetical protein
LLPAVQQLPTVPETLFNRAKSSTLQSAFRFLCILLAAIPALALSDDWPVQDVSAIAIALLLLFAIGAPEEDLKTTVRLLRPVLPAILFPVVWMVLQIAPFGLFANSIWPSASVALNEPLAGHISIEPGATIRALISYLTVVSLTVATTVITRDRARAEITLFVMCAVTVFMSVEILFGQFRLFSGVLPPPESPTAATFVAVSALGAVANAAAAVRIIERHLSRREDAHALPPVLLFCFNLAGCAICLGGILVAGRTNILIVAGSGIAVVLLSGASRLIALRPVAVGALLAIFALAVAGVIVAGGEGSPVLRFATNASPNSLFVTQRLLADAKWFGSGVGSFDALVPIYGEFGTAGLVDPASTMAKIAIEWGRTASMVIALIAVQLFAVTFAGGLSRGRDWFFPAAASGSILVLFCQAFCDTSLSHPSTQIVAAVIVGLGLSQSRGRTSGL